MDAPCITTIREQFVGYHVERLQKDGELMEKTTAKLETRIPMNRSAFDEWIKYVHKETLANTTLRFVYALIGSAS